MDLLIEIIASLNRHRSGSLWFGSERIINQFETLEVQTETLTYFLYQRFYLTGGLPWQQRENELFFLVSPASFANGVVESLQLGSMIDADWSAQREEHGAMWVSKDGLHLCCSPNLIASRHGDAGSSSTGVGIMVERVRRNLFSQFILVNSEHTSSRHRSHPTTRLYFNVRPAAIARFCKVIIDELDRRRFEYRFKILADPGAFWRNDTAILYVPTASYQPATEVLKEVLPDLYHDLRHGTPLMTKRISPGVAVAADPGNGVSFGIHRCGIIARAALQFLEGKERLSSGCLQTFDQRLLALGLDIRRPYIAVGIDDPYQSDIFKCAPVDAFKNPDPQQALSLIYERIEQSCIRQGDRTFWLKRAWLSEGEVLEPARADVYGGLPGVAWFLAEYYRVSGDKRARSLALSAWKEIERYLQHPSNRNRLGLYTGTVGTALIGRQIALALGEDCILRYVTDLARSIVQFAGDPLEPTEIDWLGGLAGTVGGLLSFWRCWGWDEALTKAGEFGDLILARARQTKRGLAWHGPAGTRSRPLLGFAHGVGGIAVAIAELAAHIGEGRYQEARDLAFAYECSFFDPHMTGWPDLRGVDVAYPFAWCHGTPGVLLARAIGHRVSGGHIRWETVHEKALANAEMEILSRCTGKESLSQCHGLAGNINILDLVNQCLGKTVRTEGTRMRVQEHISETIISELIGDPKSAPMDCSLMLGLSGIGLCLLGTQREASFPLPLALGTSAWHLAREAEWKVRPADSPMTAPGQ